MSTEMDRLEQEVTEMTTVVQAGITLIQGLAQQIRDTAGDRVKATALADELDRRATEFAQAITDNTPTPPTPPEPPVEPAGRRK